MHTCRHARLYPQTNQPTIPLRQAFVQRANDRSAPELYYGSVQWALYLAFALLLLGGCTRPLTSCCLRLRRRAAATTTSDAASDAALSLLCLSLLLLPLIGRHLALSPWWLQNRPAHPLRFVPYMLMGVVAADGLRCVY